MSTDVEEQVVYHAIEHLEFDPACELWSQHRLAIGPIKFPIWPRHACRRRAKWVGTLPCCGLTAFACGQCRTQSTPKDKFECCGRLLPFSMITWSRI